MANLTPVDNDPFAQPPASQQSNLKPIDYDPFAPPEGTAAVVARGALNAIPFANDLEAGIDTAASYANNYLSGTHTQEGEPFAQRYRENLANERGTLEREQAEHPYLSYGSTLAGTLALPVGAAEGLAGRAAEYVPGAIARSLGYGTVGAGYGAAYGAGSGTSVADRLARAKSGAELGFAGGAVAPVISGAARDIYGRAAPLIQGAFAPEAAANAKIAETLANRTPGEFGMTPNDLAAAQANGQPVTVGDLGGEATRRLARASANASPESAAALKPPLYNRFLSQGSRFGDFMQGLFGTDLNSQDALDAIRAQANNVNTPAYRAAYAKGANGVWSPQLENLVQSPAVKSAIQNANTRAVNDAVLKGQSPIVRNPFATDTSGNVSLAVDQNGNRAIPTLEYWDHVKRALDDQVSSAYSSGNRSLGGQVGQIRDSLLNSLDQAVPEYQVAREGAWNWIGARDAVSAGQKFLGQSNNIDVNATKKWLNSPSITPEQREAFAQGLGGQILQKAQNSGDNRNLVNLFNSPQFRQKMQVGLGQNRSDQIEVYLRRESMMDALRQKVMGNSTTTEQQISARQSPFSHFTEGVSNPVTGGLVGAGAAGWESDFDPKSMMRGAVVGAIAGPLVAGHGAIGENVANAIAEKLASDNPQDIQWATQQLAQNPKAMNGLRRLSMGTAVAGSRALPAPSGEGYAKGGKVKKPSHEYLVNRLMALAERAKRAEKKRTAPILNMPDDHVTAALAKAQEAI